MPSGIGPANHLKEHGIQVVLDQPLVGQGMADNPMNILVVPSPLPVEVSLVETVGVTKCGSFIETVSGLSFGHSWADRLRGIFDCVKPGQHSIRSFSITRLIFLDVRIRGPQQWVASDHSPRFTPEAMEIFADTIRSLANPILKGGVMLEKILGPKSTGHLELLTTNPNDNPSVTFNYFKDPEDLRMYVESMKTIIDVINSKAFSRFRYHNMPIQALIDMMLLLPH
ncbi:putative oxygen-dependent choline dehydrogenase, FAD/NAD(P)-binding domain-containing protein [Medicago truncatula]|uniref:Putative oxygen-dependent choline dehydrogenase, FAD/NAD(P)-binding domain-containing protein n=1 Tax=Medicago truncatula TaxID=3880 RepID=A0A396JUA9_MEDTR|nr:putative oxygen-dependent choline dehydrogenase, FAD/NAD(P)-binding domain-containing protein [Medicago truncatula]